MIPHPHPELLPFGWAPGNYIATCFDCEKPHTDSDKLSRRCLPCAKLRHGEYQAGVALSPNTVAVMGQAYRHFKGNLYYVICIGRDSEDRDKEHVVYVRYGTDNQPEVRERKMFESRTTTGISRFVQLTHEDLNAIYADPKMHVQIGVPTGIMK